MDIIIESPGFKASDELETYVRETLSKLKSDKIIRATLPCIKALTATLPIISAR